MEWNTAESGPQPQAKRASLDLMTVSDQPKTILVIDDDEALLRLIERLLSNSRRMVVAVESGEAALAWLNEKDADLTLLDLSLPKVDGWTLAHKLSTRAPPTPFVVITGHADVQAAVDMMRRGALDYLVKDVHFVHWLPSVVDRALAHVERERKLAAAEDELRQLNLDLENRVRERTRELQDANRQLVRAMSQVKTLSGLLPTCSFCKNIRDESGHWHPIEAYIMERSHAAFSHGLCPSCLRKNYPDESGETEGPVSN